MHGRKNIRLQNYDYTSNGYYFITAIARLRQNVFLGQELMIERELRDVEVQVSGVSIDYFVVMPNHIHAIIVLNNCGLHIGEIVRRFKAKVSHQFTQGIWQANYYEHVIRDERALDKIREYIQNNPQELLLQFDQFYK